jgi:haloalkane dehalogenase
MAIQDKDWVDRTEYPFADHYLNLPMGRLHYVDEGRGHPILMVHGTPEWSFGYRYLIKGLSQKYRCIAADHLGFGLSSKPAGWSYLPEEHAGNLAQLIAYLNLRDFTLIVHDYGGPIGLAYAVRHPENIHSLVLMNTWMWSLNHDPHFSGTKLFAGGLGRFLYEKMAFSARVMLPSAMGDRSMLTRPIFQQYLKAWRTSEERHGTWVFAREVLGSSAWYETLWERRDALQAIPALILWGLKDWAFRPVELEKLKTIFREPQVVTFENTGHFVTEELREKLPPLIDDFIKTAEKSGTADEYR